MLLLMLAVAATQSTSQAQASPQQAVVPPTARAVLTQQIRQVDAEFFDLFFSGACDFPRLHGMLAEGAEFYHDRKGLASTEAFVAEYRRDCENRAGRAVRRELVAGSLGVIPIGSDGAFQTGEHLFYVRSSADGPERVVDRRRFAALWRLGDDGRWRLSRIVDYRSPSER